MGLLGQKSKQRASIVIIFIQIGQNQLFGTAGYETTSDSLYPKGGGEVYAEIQLFNNFD